MPGPIPHHLASGIHPGAFVQPTAPNTTDVQDGVLWLDTSAGPPYQLKRWDAGGAAWHTVQMDTTGYPLPQGHRVEGYTRSGGRNSQTHLSGVVSGINAGNEIVVPGMDITLDSFDGSLGVSVVVTFHDQVPQDAPYHLVARLRRGDLNGPALLTQTWTTPDSQTNITFVGLINNYQWLPDFLDTEPTTGRYVVTVQKLAQDTIPITTEGRFLRVSETTSPGPRVRVVHAAVGPVLDMPFEQATEAPSAFLGRDDATGLPKWAALPLAANATSIPGVSATTDTCTQMRCGVAVALRDKLIGDYEFWRHIINATTGLALGLTIAALLDEILAVLIAMEVAQWILVVFRIATPFIKIATPVTLPSFVPAISPDQSDYLLQLLFCQLACTGDHVAIAAGDMQAVSATILANTSMWASDIQRMLLGEVAYYYPLADWQAAATNATPSVLCDGISCG